MSDLITNQAAFDALADRIHTANHRIQERAATARPVSGRRAGRVSITRLARATIAPVNMPRHRAQEEA